MKNIFMILMAASMIFLVSCSTSLQSLRPWLDSVKGEPRINVEGEWASTEAGNGILIQKNNLITGTMGSYEIQGAVNGEKVFLLFGYSGTFYYAAVLEPYKSLLVGKYSYSKPRGSDLDDKTYPMTMRKIKEIK